MRLQQFFQLIHEDDYQLEVEVRRVKTVEAAQVAFAAVEDKDPKNPKRIILDVSTAMANEILARAVSTVE